MFCCVYCEGEGPKPVVVGSVRVAEGDPTGLGMLVPLHVDLCEELRVVGYVEQRPEAHGAAVVAAAAPGAHGASLAVYDSFRKWILSQHAF